MAKLYLMRHGQTELNAAKRVQGRCDSPLTELGVAQARAAGAWLAGQNVHFDAVYASPLGRTRQTVDVVREELASGASASDNTAELARVTFAPGLIERSYGVFEGGFQADVPANVWDPGEQLVPYGGEGSASVRARIVNTLTRVMRRSGAENVFAVSHGSATLQFKLAWEHAARCPQDVRLGNCCILVFEFDRAMGVFSNTAIVNQDV